MRRNLLLALILSFAGNYIIAAQVQNDQQPSTPALVSTLERAKLVQEKVANCTDAQLPIQWSGITLNYSSGLHLSGVGTNGSHWSAIVPASSIFTCEVWATELYKNSKKSLLILNRSHDPEGYGTELTILTFDQNGLPIPWQAIGKFTSTGEGVTQLIKENQNEDSALIIPMREGNRYDGFAYLHHLVEVNATGFKKVTGPHLSTNWPMIAGNQKALCGTENKDTWSENFATGGQDKDQPTLQAVAYPGPSSGVGGITLSNGTKSMFPSMLIVNSADGVRTIYFAGDVPDALQGMIKKTYVVQLVGQTCEEEECRPLLLIAAEH